MFEKLCLFISALLIMVQTYYVFYFFISIYLSSGNKKLLISNNNNDNLSTIKNLNNDQSQLNKTLSNYPPKLYSMSSGVQRSQRIFAGQQQTCSSMQTFSLMCWGSNLAGECDIPHSLEEEVVVQASVGRHFVCAIISMTKNKNTNELGVLECWGTNANQQTVIPEALNQNVELVRVGDYHVCVKTLDEFECWGSNDHGQTDIPDEIKVKQEEKDNDDGRKCDGQGEGQVQGKENDKCGKEEIKEHDTNFEITIFSLRGYSTCVIQDAKVLCFGKFTFSQDLGKLEHKNSYLLLELGYNHVCYDYNTLNCQGDNEFGQLDFVNPSPKEKFGLLSISSQGNHTCGLYPNKNSIDTICWGQNDVGQSEIPTDDNQVQTALGDKHSCFIKGKHYVKCLGIHKYNLDSTPRVISNYTQTVKAGGKFTCVIRGGIISCQGKNQAKLNSKIDEKYLKTSENIATGQSHVCASILNLSSGTSQNCWSAKSKDNEYLTPPDDLGHLKNQQMDAGFKFTCSTVFHLFDNSIFQLICWGINDMGQLDIPGELLDSADQLTLGMAHACSTTQANSIFCWGKEDKGQIDIPQNMRENVQNIGCGQQHSCAVTHHNQGECWGFNNKGQIDIPGQIRMTLVMVEAGAEHTCGLDLHSSLMCWGDGKASRVPKGWVKNIEKVTLGQDLSCVINFKGIAKCWGENEDGQAEV